MTAIAEHETLQSLRGRRLQPLVRVECAEGGPCDVVEVVAPLLRVQAEGPDVGPEAWVSAARSGLRAACCVCRVAGPPKGLPRATSRRSTRPRTP